MHSSCTSKAGNWELVDCAHSVALGWTRTSKDAYQLG